MSDDDPLSLEDKALFRRVTQDVTPLKSNQVSTKKPVQKLGQASLSKEPPKERYLSSVYHSEVGPETILSYRGPSLPKKRFTELQKGHIPCTAKLDLHGQTSDTAAVSFLSFLDKAKAEGHRCLLIIHGKGQLQTTAPVLKNLINHWLGQIPEVLGFHSALPKDGGAGAVYVLLSKR